MRHDYRPDEESPLLYPTIKSASVFRTATVASAEVVDEAFSDIIGQLSLLFANIIDTLTPRQINFLLAVADGVTNFSSKEVLIKYQLGHLLISKI